MTCDTLPCRSCGTGSAPASPPRPRGSRRTPSSSNCWRRFRSEPMPEPRGTSWLQRLGTQARGLFQKLHRAVASEDVALARPLEDRNPQRYLDPTILAKVGFSPLLAKVVV